MQRVVRESISFPASLVDDPNWKRTWLCEQLGRDDTPRSVLEYVENEIECLL